MSEPINVSGLKTVCHGSVSRAQRHSRRNTAHRAVAHTSFHPFGIHNEEF